ncbi:MAG: DciA family protein [Pirellula sp.]|jgi:predicted nucleic acid-binding Zn ribbon protein
MDEKEEAYYLNQIPEKKGSRYQVPKISSVIRKVIQQKGYSSIQSADMLRSAWIETVGEKLGSQTTVGRVTRGQLTVVATNKVVATELEYMRSQILRSLQEKLPDFAIRSIRVSCDAMR